LAQSEYETAIRLAIDRDKLLLDAIGFKLSRSFAVCDVVDLLISGITAPPAGSLCCTIVRDEDYVEWLLRIQGADRDVEDATVSSSETVIQVSINVSCTACDGYPCVWV